MVLLCSEDTALWSSLTSVLYSFSASDASILAHLNTIACILDHCVATVLSDTNSRHQNPHFFHLNSHLFITRLSLSYRHECF